jgi:hypothetical protein
MNIDLEIFRCRMQHSLLEMAFDNAAILRDEVRSGYRDVFQKSGCCEASHTSVLEQYPLHFETLPVVSVNPIDMPNMAIVLVCISRSRLEMPRMGLQSANLLRTAENAALIRLEAGFHNRSREVFSSLQPDRERQPAVTRFGRPRCAHREQRRADGRFSVGHPLLMGTDRAGMEMPRSELHIVDICRVEGETAHRRLVLTWLSLISLSSVALHRPARCD